MIRRLLLTAILFSVIALPAKELIKIGSKVTHLPSPLFLDNSTRTLNEFNRKKYLVLFIFEGNAAALQEFPRITSTVKNFQDLVSFVGVGIGTPEKLKSLPGVPKLPFPVNVDKGSVKQLLLRRTDRTPTAILLDKNGTLLWRGRVATLPKVIRSCEAGKFNLNEQIRLEAFNAAVNTAIAKNDLKLAVKLLAEEYRKTPGRIYLLSLQVKLLKRLNDTKEIFRILHEAQKHSPRDHRIFEMEYQMIAETADDQRRGEFFQRLKKNFSDAPQVLLGVAIAELQMPSGHLELATVLDLVETGWKSNAFAKGSGRGIYALEYAKILHSIGRNDLAAEMAQFACKELAKEPKMLHRAEAALIYYRKISKFAPQVKLPDLKK